LFFRRKAPVSVYFFAIATTLVYLTVGYPGGPVYVAQIVALFAVVSRRKRAAAIAGLVVGFVAFSWVPYWFGRDSPPSTEALLALAAWLGLLFAGAEALRARRERRAELADRAREDANARVTAERLRIARDLHDVLAHNISLINVQAGVALHLMDDQPEQARSALSAIKDASKDTLRELRSVLGVLRSVDEQAERAPAPRLSEIDELVIHAKAAGLDVRKDVRGAERELPVPIELAAFRIVQEALTNVTRHANATTATVTLIYDANELGVVVDDNGSGSTVGSGSGSGIRGMRERAAALGGEVDAGPRPDGGFRVQGRLPL
jgi:signal transduction histidine kinase